MIELILNLLKLDDFYNQDELIDFAKGNYKMQTTLKGVQQQAKRNTNGDRKNS